MTDVIEIDAGIGDRVVSVRSHEPPIPNYDRSILTRRRLIDMRKGDFLGQDTMSGELNLSEITTTEAEKDSVAACGFGYVPDDRIMTKTGQYAIGEYLSRNSAWRFLMYHNYGHVPASNPGLARPWDKFRVETLTPYIAKDLNGDDMVAWPQGGDPANPVDAYWVNYCFPQTPGYAFNKDLIDEVLEELISQLRTFAYRPMGCKLDYFNPVASGYYRWTTLNAELDLDQDGVPYASDAEEQEAFAAAQIYYVQKLRSLVGLDFAITANGKAAWPGVEPDLSALLDGWFLEQFPTTPWAEYDPVGSFQALWEAKQDPGQYQDFKGRTIDQGMPIFHTDLNNAYSMSGTRADCGRAAALLFDGWWRYRPLDYYGDLVAADLDDATWDGMVATLGEPLGDVMAVGTPGTGLHSYTREFEGGTVSVSLEASQTGIAQVLFAGIGDPVTDMTPPALPTLPTLVGGPGYFTYGAGIASEPVIHQIVWSGNHTGDTLPYTSTYTTDVSGTVSGLSGGYTYHVYVRLKDEAGNPSGTLYDLGTVYVQPVVGGG